MKIAVIGAGSMGCMLGGYLREGGADVVLTVRRKELMDALNQKGLTIRMYEEDGSSEMKIPMTAVTDLQGSSRKLSFAVTPSFLPASVARRMSACRLRGRSPYPGLNRSVR